MTSTIDSKMSARLNSTSPVLYRFVGQGLAQLHELGGGRAQGELALLGPEEVTVQRVVDVDADAAVQVLGGVHDPLAAFGRPELGHRQLVGRGEALGQTPPRLPSRRPRDVGGRR